MHHPFICVLQITFWCYTHSVLSFTVFCSYSCFCLLSMQLNHSLKPPPPVTVRRGPFLRVLRLPVVMTIAKMQRQPTWQQQPSSTCLPAAGRDQRPLAPSPGNRAPRYSFIRAHYSWDVDWLSSTQHIMFSWSLLLKLHYLYMWTWQESDIEVDENGTLDLSMKKTKREGTQPPEPQSSSSSSSQHFGAPVPQSHIQPEWEEPLDFTKQSGVKEEDHEEVLVRFTEITSLWQITDVENYHFWSVQITHVLLFFRWSIWLHHTPHLMVKKMTRRTWRTGSTLVKSPLAASRSSFSPKTAKKRFLCK